MKGTLSLTAIKIKINLVFFHTKRIILLHVLVVDRRVVGKVLLIGSLQLGDVIAHVLSQFLVFPVIGESLMSHLRGILLMKDVEQHDRIAHHGVHDVHNVHTSCHLHASRGSTTRQHPGIAETLVKGLQLIHILQDGQHLLLGLQYVRSHAIVVLAGHHLQEFIEILRVGLCQFQRIHHAHGLLQIIILIGYEPLVADGLIGRHEFIHRLIVGQFEGVGSLHVASRQQDKTEQQNQGFPHFQYLMGSVCKDNHSF